MWLSTQKIFYYRTHVSLFSCLVQIWFCSVVETWPMWPQGIGRCQFRTLVDFKAGQDFENVGIFDSCRTLSNALTAFTNSWKLWQLLRALAASIRCQRWSCEIFAKLWFANWQTRQNNLIGPRANKKFEFSYQPRQVSEDFGGGWLNCVLDFSDTYMQVRKNNFVIGMQVAYVRCVLEEEIELRRQNHWSPTKRQTKNIQCRNSQ